MILTPIISLNDNLTEIFPLINRHRLYQHHLGIPDNSQEQKHLKIKNQLEELFYLYQSPYLRPKAIYQILNFSLKNQSLTLHLSQNQTSTIQFKSSDFYEGKLAIVVLTIGESLNEKIKELTEDGEYLKAHILSSLAIELTEAYAIYLQQKIMPLIPATHAERLSIGYPLLTNMEDQKNIFKILKPEVHINVSLTENYMMIPETSISAIILPKEQAISL